MMPTMMSARRALELIMGGPARPFDLTVREADMLRDALDAYRESYASAAGEIGADDERDREADAGALARAAELSLRLRSFMVGAEPTEWPSLEAFYAAKPGRARSGEMDFGVHWQDDAGGRFRVSAICDTGEVYALRLGPGMRDAGVELLASGLPTGPGCYEEAERRLAGWADEFPNTLEWARGRLA